MEIYKVRLVMALVMNLTLLVRLASPATMDGYFDPIQKSKVVRGQNPDGRGNLFFQSLGRAGNHATVVTDIQGNPIDSRKGTWGSTGKQIGMFFVGTFKKVADNLSDSLIIKPKIVRAVDPVKLSSQSEPLSVDVLMSAARLYERQNNRQQAERAYRRAVEKSPENLDALMGLARFLDRQRDFQQAIKIYQAAIAAHPNSASAFNDLGLCLARQGKNVESVQYLQQAVKRVPKSQRYRNNLATVLVEMRRFDEAMQHLQAVHGTAVAHYNFGYLLHQQDEMRQASDHFAHAAVFDPSLTIARPFASRQNEVGL